MKTIQRMFVNPSLQDHAAKFAVYHVIVAIDALNSFLSNVTHAAHDAEQKKSNSGFSVPAMNEFLDFAWLDHNASPIADDTSTTDVKSVSEDLVADQEAKLK